MKSRAWNFMRDLTAMSHLEVVVVLVTFATVGTWWPACALGVVVGYYVHVVTANSQHVWIRAEIRRAIRSQEDGVVDERRCVCCRFPSPTPRCYACAHHDTSVDGTDSCMRWRMRRIVVGDVGADNARDEIHGEEE